MARVNAAGAFRWLGAALAVLVVALALAVSAFRLFVPNVPEYRDEIAAWAARVLGAPVEIGGMDLQWRGLRPELILTGVRFVSADARHAFAAREVRVGISVRSLTRGRIAPARIVLIEPDLTLEFDSVGDVDGTRWRTAFEDRGHRGEVYVEGGRATLRADGGRRRIDFDRVNAAITSDGTAHRVRVHARPGGIEGDVRIELDARGWPGARGLHADGIISLRALDLVAMQRLGRHGRLQAGYLDLSADLSVRDGALTMSTDVGLSGLRWAAGDGAIRRVERAAARIGFARDGEGLRMSIGDLAVTHADGVRDSGHLEVARDADGRWQATAERVRVDDLAVLAEALPWSPDARIADWIARSPRGLVDAARLSLAAGTRDFRLTFNGSALGIEPSADGRMPGFSGLDVRAEAGDRGGEAVLAVADGSLWFPNAFRGPFPLTVADARLSWRDDGGRWRIEVASIHASNAHATAGGSGVLEWPRRGGGERRLQLDATFDDVDLAAHPPYLPVSVMSPALVAWLDRAVDGGRAGAGRFRYDGVLGDGALRDGRATLAVESDIADLSLDFADDWPELTDGGAHVSFTGTSFAATVRSGDLHGMPVSGATVGVAAFSEPVLEIDGSAAGDLGPMLDAFRATPPGARAWLHGAHAAGDARVAVEVSLPLRGGGATVRGTLHLHQASMEFGGFPHPFGDVSGRVSFTEDGADAERVTGTLYAVPLGAVVTTLRDNRGTARAVEVVLHGTADTALLSRVTGIERMPVTGSTHWTARLLTPYGDGQVPYFEIESSLQGLAISLPDPLGKEAAASRPLTLRAELLDGARRFTLDGAPAIHARGVLRADGGQWRLTQAGVHIGQGDAPAVPAAGVALTGSLARWAHGVADGTPGIGAGLPVSRVDLHVGELSAYGRSLGAVQVEGARDGDAWRWALTGANVRGTLHVPDAPTNDAPVRADFERLEAGPANAGTRVEGGELDARAVPPLVFHAARLAVGALAFGEVNGTLVRVENGISLQGFSSSRDALRLAGDATWHTVDGFHRTVVRATADSVDVRQALAGLGYSGSLDAAAGHLQVDVNWLDSPLANPLPLLNGTLSVRFERGTLHDVQPGAGRMFGLLSLNALPRRLALDFSDVYRRGLAFDSISGSFEVRDGDAFTEDLRLNGPAARVEVRGRAGLGARDYDQEATVVASLASSLAIAGTLAGGPGVGAAVLIASELLRAPLEEMARVRYRVTGPWEQPVIERIVVE